jgi:hypothetical protein
VWWKRRKTIALKETRPSNWDVQHDIVGFIGGGKWDALIIGDVSKINTNSCFAIRERFVPMGWPKFHRLICEFDILEKHELSFGFVRPLMTSISSTWGLRWSCVRSANWIVRWRF